MILAGDTLLKLTENKYIPEVTIPGGVETGDIVTSVKSMSQWQKENLILLHGMELKDVVMELLISDTESTVKELTTQSIT